MYLDRILYPVTALGPGRRLAIWVAGCQRHCPGCANPELWRHYPEQEISPESLFARIQQLCPGGFDGLTITGGEPFEQAEELSRFLSLFPVRPETLVFSGYTLRQLRNRPECRGLLRKTDVLIDGPYVNALNDGYSVLRGSRNQSVRFLSPGVEQHYWPYLQMGRQIQNFIYDYRILSVGIHNPPSGGEYDSGETRTEQMGEGIERI